MTDKNLTDFGKQLSESVQKAVNSEDFAKIKETVSATMKEVVGQTVSFGRQVSEQVQQTVEHNRKTSHRRHTRQYAPPVYSNPVYCQPIVPVQTTQYMVKPNSTIVSGRLGPFYSQRTNCRTGYDA